MQETMEQARAVKLELERRLGVVLDGRSKALEWIAEHASLLNSRYKLGADGKEAYRRLKGKECSAKTVGFGEQVLAKPKRNPRTTRKQSLKSR